MRPRGAWHRAAAHVGSAREVRPGGLSAGLCWAAAGDGDHGRAGRQRHLSGLRRSGGVGGGRDTVQLPCMRERLIIAGGAERALAGGGRGRGNCGVHVCVFCSPRAHACVQVSRVRSLTRLAQAMSCKRVEASSHSVNWLSGAPCAKRCPSRRLWHLPSPCSWPRSVTHPCLLRAPGTLGFVCGPSWMRPRVCAPACCPWSWTASWPRHWMCRWRCRGLPCPLPGAHTRRLRSNVGPFAVPAILL